MKFRIGYRTIKTALGTTLSILLAQTIGLHNFASAGILTILCIKPTKVKSVKASWDRVLACMIAMAFSTLFFEGITYHPITIGLMLLFFIPTAVMFRAQEGIVSSSVIILHIYMAGNVTFELILNELGIVIIGVGMALIMNLYMPSAEKKLVQLQAELEENFRKIMLEIVHYLRTSDSSWDGSELTKTARVIDEAKTLAFHDVENHFRRNENLYYHYFKMREKQFEIIERILPLVASLPVTVVQGQMIGDFLEELAEYISPGEVPKNFLENLLEMREEFQSMELPQTREEFEVRASLLQLTKEMEQYLMLKNSFKYLKREKKKYRKGSVELQ
ncbi:aromatic acid exporter family protein [Robertmurraya massiliosenegalensis]|uniref:aromatic acid exporter family protein n=1 Tax=Robertmurraya massiliosenegalensis TaxID=1287657 RepID=UPI0002EA2696|nr:aromatic acid exporter family protein [Robertmurraya massiliosenegalensis]